MISAAADHLLTACDSAIATITLNRPERRNALSLALMRDLIAELERTAARTEIRAVILAAAGSVFCSGHDLSELRGAGLDEQARIFDVCTRLMETIQRVPQPVIARVQGMATAAGCQLVASCDLAIAAEGATFATPGVRIGLFCTTPMVALTRAIGRKRAMEMLLTGNSIEARTAAEWGLVNRAVPADSLDSETRALAERIAWASGYTVGTGKQAFYRQIDLPQPQAYEYAKQVMTVNGLADDAQEGIAAFLEKRPPCWRNR
ncbi:MAG TPA: enoyl-CoA hydratase [Bryobacteraceae bacterium]|nr:enoyl-CoA hydratase [Bryobacteraceae bacterium]